MNRDQRLFNFCLWFFVGSLLLVIPTSCNPYAALYPNPTQTQIPTATAPDLATPELPAVTLTPAPLTCTVRTGIDAGNLNIRTGPGISHAVIEVLTEGEVLTVIARGAWHEVTDAQGNHGFINSRYCEIGE